MPSTSALPLLVDASMLSPQTLDSKPCLSQNHAKLALAVTGGQAAEQPTCAGTCKGRTRELSRDKVLSLPLAHGWSAPAEAVGSRGPESGLSWGCLPPGRPVCACAFLVFMLMVLI